MVHLTLEQLEDLNPWRRGVYNAPERVNVAGYPLRRVSPATPWSTWFAEGADYARTDGSRSFSWLRHRVVRAANRRLSPFFARCILTLMIWGLADVPVGAVPSWCHVGKRRPGLLTKGMNA